MLEHKSFAASEVKVLDGDAGEIEAVVAVFNNVDHGKDRIIPGFFAKSLERKLPRGVWGHDWATPVAKTLEARELHPGDPSLPGSLAALGGLYIKAKFNLDTQRGREAFSDIKFGIIDEFSIGYKASKTKLDQKTGVRDLIEGEVYEWSPVLVGMNSQTALISAKDAKGDPVPANDRADIIAAKRGHDAKGQYLGDAEETAAYAVVGRLHDLVCWAIFSILSDDRIDLAARLAMLGDAVDEFRDVLVRLVGAILAGAGDDAEGPPADLAETMSKQFRARFGLPDPDSGDLVLAVAAKDFAAHSRQVVSAVGELTGRASDRIAARLKDGRELSAANRRALNDVHDGLMAHAGTIADLLDRTAPKEKADDGATDNRAAEGDAEGKADDATPAAPEAVDYDDVLIRHHKLRAALRGLPVGS